MGDTPDTESTSSKGAKASGTKQQVTWKGIVDVDESRPRGGMIGRVRHAIGGGGSSGGGGGRSDGGDEFPDPYAGLRRRRRFLSFAAVIVVIGLALVVSMVHIVPPGKVIVPQVFGSAKPALGEGLHVTLPWPIERVSTLTVQTRNYTMSAAKAKGTDPAVLVLGFDGASATVDATVLYRLEPKNATRVFREVGPNYLATVIVPSARTCIREAYAGVDLVRAATGDFPGISASITACLKEKVGSKGITVVDFQLRDLALSTNIQKAVDLKVASDQQIVASQHRADAQRLEAKGQADAAQVLACGGKTKATEVDGKMTLVVEPNTTANCETPPLDSNMLTYNYIQALRDIINSPNSTVILPSGDSGQPIVNVPATPATPAAP